MELVPWHKGEAKFHEALGVTEKMQSLGRRMIRDHMPDQHREFYNSLEFVILSALDDTGSVWPFIWSGPQGFITSPDPKHLIIKFGALSGQAENLLLKPKDKISILGIIPETKRRNRVNGTITDVFGDAIKIMIDQSYGNCPRYIHVREKGLPQRPGPIEDRNALIAEDITHIQQSDTLFIASRSPQIGADPREGIDVNHRGGLPGFVKVLQDHTIIIPDYDGNKFFNTFGNIIEDPRTGLLIPNYISGDLLTLNGTAKIIMEDEDGERLYGSKRYIMFRPDRIRRAYSAFPFTHSVAEYSTNPPAPGDFNSTSKGN